MDAAIAPAIPTVGAAARPAQRQSTAGLALLALGVVYGDIGTSPLYAAKETFNPVHGIALTTAQGRSQWQVESCLQIRPQEPPQASPTAQLCVHSKPMHRSVVHSLPSLQ